eukprot:UN07286
MELSFQRELENWDKETIFQHIPLADNCLQCIVSGRFFHTKVERCENKFISRGTIVFQARDAHRPQARRF